MNLTPEQQVTKKLLRQNPDLIIRFYKNFVLIFELAEDEERLKAQIDAGDTRTFHTIEKILSL